MSDVLGPIAAFTFTILIIGYLVQSRLPPPKPKIVGIDLGTTFSCVGVYNAVSGNVTVLIDEQGDRLTPSVVYIGNTDVIIGSGASLQSAKHPENLIYDAKRFMGKEVPSKDYLSRIQNLYPFKIVEDGKDRNGFKFSVSNSGNVSYFEPEDIGAFILRKLKKTAEQKLERKITMAVMSVPAEFDSKQRNATVEAGKRAGLHVLRLINEPTAAALAYGLHKRDGINNVIVVDFGGGTMDVSLLSIQGGMFYTIAMTGNNRLGGQDVNQNLMEYLKLVISKTHGIDLSNQMDLQRLRSEVENIKINLTSFFVVDIHIPFQTTFKNGSHFTFNHRINRETFNDINAELFLKVLKPIKRVLDEAKFSTNDVDEIVLVGGSTRIPKVRDIVGDFFGKKPNVEIDPELAVVTGVSIQAGILGGMWPLQVAAVELPTSHIQKIQVGDD